MTARNQQRSALQDSHELPYLKNIPSLFKSTNAWGISTSIDARNCDPDIIRSKEALSRYVIELCDLIDMKRFGDPTIIHFGEDARVAGYSLAQFIETSMISGHFANDTNTAYIDIFSCKSYDPHEAAEFTKKFFKSSNYRIHTLLRD